MTDIKELLAAAQNPEIQARQERLDRRKFEYHIWMVNGDIVNTEHLMISAGGVAVANDDADPTTDEYDENGGHVFYPFTQVLRIDAKWWVPDDLTPIEEVRGRYL